MVITLQSKRLWVHEPFFILFSHHGLLWADISMEGSWGKSRKCLNFDCSSEVKNRRSTHRSMVWRLCSLCRKTMAKVILWYMLVVTPSVMMGGARRNLKQSQKWKRLHYLKVNSVGRTHITVNKLADAIFRSLCSWGKTGPLRDINLGNRHSYNSSSQIITKCLVCTTILKKTIFYDFP